MMNQDQKHQKYTSNLSEIITLAKDRNIRELQNLTNRRISIDERTIAKKINIINGKEIECTLLLTPAGILAMNGDFESANFLKEYCFANVDFIAYGAACGGHFGYVKILQTDDHANFDYIAEGAAFNGNESYIKELLMENKGINRGRIARGLANGNHREKAKIMRDQYQSNNDIVYWLASGAGRSGIRDYAEDLRLEANAHVVDWIAEGAACCGHTKYVDEVLRPQPQGADAIKIANNAVYGGHFDYIHSINHDFYKFEHSSLLNLCGYAAEGGHFAYAHDFSCEGDYNNLEFLFAIKGGHVTHAENLFYLYDGLELDDIGNKVEEFIKNDEKRTLLFLAQAKTEKFRKILFKSLAKGSVKNHFKDTRLLEKATAISSHMANYNIGMSQALCLIQEESSLKGLVDFEIECSFPRELNIIIFLYVCELNPLIGRNLYQNFSAAKNLIKIDDQHYSRLGLFSDNKSIKDKFITNASNVITSLPVNSRSHFFQLCGKSKTACYHRVLFPLTSHTSKKFQEHVKAIRSTPL